MTTALAYSFSNVASGAVIKSASRLASFDVDDGSPTLPYWQPYARQHRAPAVIAERALARLDELENLEADWDSYGAAAPSPRSLAMARVITLRLTDWFQDRAVPVEVMPIADGGVQLEWQHLGDTLALNAAPDGSWSYLLIQYGADGRTFEERYGLDDIQAVALVVAFLDR